MPFLSHIAHMPCLSKIYPENIPFYLLCPKRIWGFWLQPPFHIFFRCFPLNFVVLNKILMPALFCKILKNLLNQILRENCTFFQTPLVIEMTWFEAMRVSSKYGAVTFIDLIISKIKKSLFSEKRTVTRHSDIHKYIHKYVDTYLHE